MGDLSEFPLAVQLFLKTYRWRRIDPVPWTPLRKPLAECRLGLVSTAGLSLPGQEPFDPKVRGGDPSFREIPSSIRAEELVENHRSESWDHRGVEEDRNLAFPIDRATELVGRGRLGALADRHLSFMGSVTAPGRMIRDHLAPAAQVLVDEGVDVALLVPV
jgi:D-proline reductase (dithiol) PrdB